MTLLARSRTTAGTATAPSADHTAPDLAPSTPASPGTVAPTARQRTVDAAVALALAGAAVLSLVLTRDAGVPQPSWAPGTTEQIAWVVSVTLPLAVRRRWPVPVLALVAALYIAQQARGVFEPYVTSVALYLALYTVGAWCHDRRLATASRTVVVAAMFAWLGISLSLTAWGEHALPDADAAPVGLLPPRTAAVVLGVAFNAVFFAAAWVFGDLAWRERCQREELAAAHAALRRSQAENARRAVLGERVRIARELHDVVASHVSVMGVQAGAARRVLDADPAAAREALRAVETSGRTAVAQMHQLVGVLRSDDGHEGSPLVDRAGAPEPPVPVLGEVPALVEAVRSAGLDADVEVVGEVRPVSAAVGVSAYRVVQEALTNVVRHAAARSVRVRVRYLAAAVEVEVVDDGRGGGAGAAGGTSGQHGVCRTGAGLVGMAERVALHDGLLETGPRPGGGFRVRARFPLRDAG